MFSYYGSKSKIVKKYPAPIKDTIIEPFAGSAQYSFLHYDRKVVLNEINPLVYELWEWLIGTATPSDILGLPTFGPREKIDIAPGPWRTLVAFESNMGTETPRNVAGKFNRWYKHGRQRIADALPQIRHWEIVNSDYRDLANRDATWFIDPPYQFGGHEYSFGGSGFDYGACRTFCEERLGQVIVCENTEANWMNFEPLVQMRGQRFSRTEAVWINNNDGSEK